MRLPTLRQLQYFLAVTDTMSFTQAAAQCHITQPSLSLALNELEDTIGEKLFLRATRKMELSPVGKELIPLARSIIEQSENFVRTAQRHRAPLTGSLSLGIIPTIAPYLLPKLLPSLQRSYPSLDLKLKEDVTGRQLDALKAGDIDVVLMAMPYDTPHMEQMMLWTEPFFLASSREYQLPDATSSEDAIKIEDLQSQTILLLDDGHCLRDHIISACQLANSNSTRKTLGATSLQTLLQMVQNGYGATLLPAMAIDPYRSPAGILIQRFSNPQPTRQIGLVWRKDDPRAEEFRILGDFIKKVGR